MKIFGINFSKVSTAERTTTEKNPPFIISLNDSKYYAGATEGIPTTGNYEPPIGFDYVLEKYASVVDLAKVINGPHDQLEIAKADYIPDAGKTIDDDPTPQFV